MDLQIDRHSKTPIYKQVVEKFKRQILDKSLSNNELLPSMNHLCDSLNISKETVKKAYNILRAEGYIHSAHGKGFFVNQLQKQPNRVLILFDILSTYKKDLFSSFSEHMDPYTEYTIRLFNQDIDLFERFLTENLGLFDYYVITPHLPLDAETQRRVVKVLKKIPNRQLVLLDRHLEHLSGRYISVYQDFERDIYIGLRQARHIIQSYSRLNVCIMPGSLYGELMRKRIKQFCEDFEVPYSFFDKKVPEQVIPGDAYLVLSGQLESELIQIAEMAKAQKLKIGKDIGLLAYNDSAINAIILDGLSVLSTDFKEMGAVAATLIKEGKYKKVKCRFGFVKRHTL